MRVHPERGEGEVFYQAVVSILQKKGKKQKFEKRNILDFGRKNFGEQVFFSSFSFLFFSKPFSFSSRKHNGSVCSQLLLGLSPLLLSDKVIWPAGPRLLLSDRRLRVTHLLPQRRRLSNLRPLSLELSGLPPTTLLGGEAPSFPFPTESLGMERKKKKKKKVR